MFCKNFPELKREKGCLIIAEVAQAHDGSLGMAHSFIDAIAKTGVDAVKFQTHIASAESTPSEPWRIKFSKQDETRYDYWKRMEFTKEQWQGLKEHATKKGLLFLSTPFSIEAVELLNDIGVSCWKVASGELTNRPLFEAFLKTSLPVILSTGMSSIEEIDSAVELVKNFDIPLSILQCTSMYPSSPDKIGLNLLNFYQNRYNCPVGLSDHSGTIFPGLAAVTLGAEVLEVHATLSREMFGPDVVASLTTSELSQLVKGVRFIEEMLTNPVNKKDMTEELISMRSLFTKSIVAKVNLDSGTTITEKLLAYKKPGTGIPASEYKQLIGKKIRKTVLKDEFITYDDFE